VRAGGAGRKGRTDHGGRSRKRCQCRAAGAIDEIFIRWRASGTVNGRFREWTSVDHIRFRGGEVIQIDAVYDTAEMA
jgi:hypothetical protein